MLEKKVSVVLAGCGVVSVLGALLFWKYSGGVSPIFVLRLPFAAAGNLLRELSLQSWFLDKIAVILWLVLSFWPVVLLLYRMKKKKSRLEDILLAVISCYGAVLLYCFINPALFLQENSFFKNKVFLKGLETIWAGGCLVLWISYLMALALRKDGKSTAAANAGDTGKVVKCFQILLFGAGIVVVCQTGYLKLADLLIRLERETVLEIKGAACIQYLLDAIPYIGLCVLITEGIHLLETLKSPSFGREEALSADKLEKKARVTGYLAILSCLGWNALQFICIRAGWDSDFRLWVPLYPLAITLGAKVLGRYLYRAWILQQEMDAFI